MSVRDNQIEKIQDDIVRSLLGTENWPLNMREMLIMSKIKDMKNLFEWFGMAIEILEKLNVIEKYDERELIRWQLTLTIVKDPDPYGRYVYLKMIHNL